MAAFAIPEIICVFFASDFAPEERFLALISLQSRLFVLIFEVDKMCSKAKYVKI